MIKHWKKFDKVDVLIIILVLVALGLGIAIFKQKTASSSNYQSRQLDQVETEQAIQTPDESSLNRRPTPAGLSDQEKKLMMPPPQNATRQQKEEFAELIYNVATESDTVVLNNCDNVNPLVLKVADGEEISIQNNTSATHVLTIGGKDYEFKEDEEKGIKASFTQGPGWYGYSCDKETGVVGYFLVTPGDSANNE